MPDEQPQIMTAWMPALSRQGRVYVMPVSLPLVPGIADEPRYQQPAGFTAVRGRRYGPPRFIADQRALTAWRKT
jgi:hypothetical protein